MAHIILPELTLQPRKCCIKNLSTIIFMGSVQHFINFTVCSTVSVPKSSSLALSYTFLRLCMVCLMYLTMVARSLGDLNFCLQGLL